MGHKTKPKAFRLGVNTTWSSKWFFKKSLRSFLAEDDLIRKIINKNLRHAGIAEVIIERNVNDVKVTIKSNRPGLLIGRKGKGIEDLRNLLLKSLLKLRKEKGINQKINLNINIEEISRLDVSAQIVADQIAADLEKRLPFRTVIKRHLKELRQKKDVKGAKIKVSGRLNGAEIARSEWLDFGRMPLNTLRANIDYGESTAFTTYGTTGIKVWIYKGDIV